jgi:hypothetical protein
LRLATVLAVQYSLEVCCVLVFEGAADEEALVKVDVGAVGVDEIADG